MIKGKPNELVRNGEFIRSHMRRDHVADEDFCEDLRLDGEEDLAKVKVARLECNSSFDPLDWTFG